MSHSILKTVYPSILLLAFVAFSCTKKNQQQPDSTTGSTTNTASTTGSTTSGGNTTLDQKDSLTGTTWVLYQYRDQYTTTPLPRTDTLVFTSINAYTWNGLAQTYSLNIQGNVYNKYVFTLKNTPFGTLRGLVPLTIKQYGEVINEPFSQSGVSSPQTFFLWLKKIS